MTGSKCVIPRLDRGIQFSKIHDRIHDKMYLWLGGLCVFAVKFFFFGAGGVFGDQAILLCAEQGLKGPTTP